MKTTTNKPTEKEIEERLIDKLCDLKYTYRPEINDLYSLNNNFRAKFEELNGVTLTDAEFKRLLGEIISFDVFNCARILRERNTFERDDGTRLHFTLVHITDWCKNSFEVINQLRINTENSHQRYDVMLLLNGLPLVQIELKGLSISPRVAMRQIVEYKNEPGNGYTRTLLCFVQLFIVSNRCETWFFANNNDRHFKFDAQEQFLPAYQFADEKNKKIAHLDDFAEKFLSKCTLGETISRYMVLVASEEKLIMMRPYQMYAVKAIVDCIDQNRGNGYIWHTTGSGKTLTSFKASTLLKENPAIQKCVFVVDRKDLDSQTREEFNKFQKGCVEENTNTETLVKRLLSEDYADKVIVTTIQKLGLALDGSNKNNYKQQLKPLVSKRVVFIFDECHRSQFGEYHKAIKEFFPKSQLFGFTGTPIFEINARSQQIEGKEASFKTTMDVFEKQLHAYTITHAIEDNNVLRFHIDYYKAEGKVQPKPGEPLTQEAVVKAILQKHDGATCQRKFNAIFATSSIDQAIEYYRLFKTIQTERTAADPSFNPLSIACVFSPPAEGNKDIQQIQEDLPQEQQDNKQEPDKKKAALKQIIADYNQDYGTNHNLGDFDLYYKDIQQRIKDQQYASSDIDCVKTIDLVIVVDMLLTGFDSKYLNTLYVDKNLKYHGLIQAFSRTNRILNAAKPIGNILDFRQQQDAVNDAIALFSGEKIDRAKEIWLVDPAPVVIGKLETAIEKLETFMGTQGLDCAPEQVANLKGDAARGEFVALFKEVQRLKIQLDQYTDLREEDIQAIEKVLPAEQLWGFRGVYLETAQRLRANQNLGSGGAGDGLGQAQTEFDFVLFASALIDHDYITKLISNYTHTTPDKQKMTRDELIGIINADAKFMDEREDIAAYIESLKLGTALSEKEIRDGYNLFKKEKHSRLIAEIAASHGLEPQALQDFIEGILDRMIFDGEHLGELLAPLELGWKDRVTKEKALMNDLVPLLNKLAHGREISGLRAYEN